MTDLKERIADDFVGFLTGDEFLNALWVYLPAGLGTDNDEGPTDDVRYALRNAMRAALLEFQDA